MATSVINNIRIACWNCRGLSASIPFLRTLLSENDIVCLSEHWLHNNRLSQLDEVCNDFYNFGKSSRVSSEESFGLRRGQGGVAIFWRKTLRGVSAIKTLSHDRICGIRMECEGGTVLVFLSVYMPASGSRDNLAVTLDELEAIIDGLEAGAIRVVCGDFNGNMGSAGGKRGTGPPTKAGRTVLNFMNNLDLTAINLRSSATGHIATYEGHNGRSVIDYIMIPKFLAEKIRKCHTGRNEALNTSDHLPIEAILMINILPRFIELEKNNKRIRWDKCSHDHIIQHYEIPVCLELREVDIILDQQGVPTAVIDECMDKIITSLHEGASVIPKSKFATHLKPYWNAELSDLKKAKMMWFNRWKVEGRALDVNDPVRINMLKKKKKKSLANVSEKSVGSIKTT